MRHADRQGARVGQRTRVRHRARLHVRLPQSRRRHARVPDDPQPRRAGRLRRDAQPAAARRRRRRHRRSGRVHRAAGVAPASPPASTACSWKSTKIRRARRATAQNALRLDRLRPLLDAPGRARRDRAADAAGRRGGLTTAPRHDPCPSGRPPPRRPRPTASRSRARVLETEAAAILGLVATLDHRFERAVELLARLPRPGHRHRHGQVRDHLPQDRGDAGEHRHAGLLPASGRGGARRSRRASRPRTWSSRCRTAARRREVLRVLETIKRIGAHAGRADRARRVDAGPGRRRRRSTRHVNEEACPLNLAPTASTTAALALGDALAMTLLVRRGFREEDFAHLHPGGKLGKGLMRAARADARRRRPAAGRAGRRDARRHRRDERARGSG